MEDAIKIGILCLDFDVARNFYTTHLGFDITIDKNIAFGNEKIRRLVLRHAIIEKLEIEFHKPSNEAETIRIGMQGGTKNLFSIPTRNIDEITAIMKKTSYFIDVSEAPYATFLNITDPMGNKICLYQKIL